MIVGILFISVAVLGVYSLFNIFFDDAMGSYNPSQSTKEPVPVELPKSMPAVEVPKEIAEIKTPFSMPEWKMIEPTADEPTLSQRIIFVYPPLEITCNQCQFTYKSLLIDRAETKCPSCEMDFKYVS